MSANAPRGESNAAGRPRVRIVGDHPHQGKTGTVCDDEPMKYGMWRVVLDDGYADACFAGRGNLRPLPADEDPHA